MVLKEWIEAIVPFSAFYNPGNVVRAQEPVEEAFDSVISRYVSGIDPNLKIKWNKNKFSWQHIPEIPPKVNLRNNMNLSKLNNFSPLYMIKEGPNTYHIILEVPTMRSSDIKIDQATASTPNCWGIKVSGEKKKTR